MQKRILIAGGTGLIGTALTAEAARQGYQVLCLSRSPGPNHVTWDPASQHIDLVETTSFDAIVNLTGDSLAKGRWTSKKKKEIVDSRINSCRTIHQYLSKGILQTPVYVGSSGVGYYRNSGVEKVDETNQTKDPDDFLVDTVIQWEKAHQEMESLGIRTIIIRTGIVLSMKGGALKEIVDAARWGVVPFFGHGRQIWPWIHIMDYVRAVLFLIEQQHLKGVFIGASPHAVSNKELAKAINHELNPRRLVAGVPTIILKIILGELHTALLDSCHAYPAKLLQNNFQFNYAQIRDAMRDLMKKEK